jgi:HEAT repeat protein
MMLDPRAGWQRRGIAATVLALADARSAVATLLDLFFAQTDETELWETALTIECFGNRGAVRGLANALYDTNPHRRHAAARALGWIPGAGSRAAKALIRAVSDKSPPEPVREEAAESLAYLQYKAAIPILISALEQPEVKMRFWAVFALGGLGRRRGKLAGADSRVVEALEGMLLDGEVPPGNWWSVGREALAMLSQLEPKYLAKLDQETRRVLRDSNSSPEDLRWAEGYSVKQRGFDVLKISNLARHRNLPSRRGSCVQIAPPRPINAGFRNNINELSEARKPPRKRNLAAKKIFPLSYSSGGALLLKQTGGGYPERICDLHQCPY